MSVNVAAPIRSRLLIKARSLEEEFERFLVRYACERFLYRLGETDLREKYILKGANLVNIWLEEPYRTTRDIDLLAFGRSDAATLRAAMETVCGVPCPEDGLDFIASSLKISSIKDDQEYPGHRAKLHARLGSARINIQVDLGFGGILTSGTEEAQFPTLIDGLPVPRLRA